MCTSHKPDVFDSVRSWENSEERNRACNRVAISQENSEDCNIHLTWNCTHNGAARPREIINKQNK